MLQCGNERSFDLKLLTWVTYQRRK